MLTHPSWVNIKAGWYKPIFTAEPGQHLAMPIDAIIAASGGIARPGPTVAAALVREAGPRERRVCVLICGSL